MNVPNRLTILRVAMIPLFVIAMLWQQLPYSDYIAGGLFIAACITDFLSAVFVWWLLKKELPLQQVTGAKSKLLSRWQCQFF